MQMPETHISKDPSLHLVPSSNLGPKVTKNPYSLAIQVSEHGSCGSK